MVANVNAGRWTAHIEGDFVVFLIGARFNSLLNAVRARSPTSAADAA